MRNYVRVRFTDPADIGNVQEWESLASAARALGVGVQSFRAALPSRTGESRLYRGWLIERLDDPPRRHTEIAEIEHWAHVMALGDAEQAVLARDRQEGASLDDKSVDDAIAREYKERYAWYLATAVIEEIHWRTGHEMSRSRPSIAPEPSAPTSQRRAGTPGIRQRKRPHRS
ncbi:MAG: hypothetical protein ACTHNZ_09975 [Trinickia sp.]|uniref:hypothetical protein n=1 Tax=Trinickia sp. TaxID=2571163 RepID=UPI003F7F25DD